MLEKNQKMLTESEGRKKQNGSKAPFSGLKY